MYVDYLETPLGTFEIMATEQGVCQAIFCGEERKAANGNDITNLCKKELTEYFANKRRQFTVPLDPQGSPFQQAVWQCLTDIPFGEVKSYGDIAKQLNKPKASQAVGGANGRNPITLLIPCHRVIGANGSLTGYAGGLERKLWLLQHEGADIKTADENQQLNINTIKHKRQEKAQFLR